MSKSEYVPHRDREKRVRSATKAIKVLVDARKSISESHLKELIRICLWKISIADGKTKTRYCSFKSKSVINTQELQHDHVFENRKLIGKILDNPDNIEKVVNDCIGCVVTKKEHERLTKISRENPCLEGWQRYDKAGIKVVDRKNGS